MTQNSNLQSQLVSGVFPDLVNHASFADKVIISVWRGQRRELPIDVVAKPSRPIGGRPGRVYARSMPLIFHGTGNEGDLRYGKLRPLSRIPTCQLVLRSVGTPLDEGQVKRVLAGLFVGRCRTTVSQIEMTFDTTGTPIRFLQQSVLTRARKFLLFRDPLGNEALYIGGPRSTWQVRIYQKTRQIVRIEFVLRRQLLRDQGVLTYEDVASLRGLDIRRIACFLELGRPQLREALKFVQPGWQKDISLDWVPRRPLQLLVQSLRRENGIDVEPLLRDSAIQLILDRMRSNFIW